GDPPGGVRAGAGRGRYGERGRGVAPLARRTATACRRTDPAGRRRDVRRAATIPGHRPPPDQRAAAVALRLPGPQAGRLKRADPFDRSAPAWWEAAKMLTRNGRPLREVTQGAAHRWWALTAVEFGGGLVLANVMAEITAVFPKHERRKAMAVNTSVLALAQVTGLVFGGLLIDQFGWR